MLGFSGVDSSESSSTKNEIDLDFEDEFSDESVSYEWSEELILDWKSCPQNTYLGYS